MLRCENVAKALKHKVRNLTFEQIIDHCEDGQFEKLEIECVASERTMMRIFVWGDRWVWADFRASTKKDAWLWEFTVEGRVFSDNPGKQLLMALEESIAATFGMTAGELHRFERIWAPVLARGPKEVRHG